MRNSISKKTNKARLSSLHVLSQLIDNHIIGLDISRWRSELSETERGMSENRERLSFERIILSQYEARRAPCRLIPESLCAVQPPQI
jgi:hypothetical protein